MKRKITAAAAFALCVAMGVCACSPSEKEDTFTGKEKEELAWQPNLDRISPEVYADISNLDLKPGMKGRSWPPRPPGERPWRGFSRPCWASWTLPGPQPWPLPRAVTLSEV